MSGGQKFVKVLAIILAIFIICNIVAAIFAGISIFKMFLEIDEYNESSYETSYTIGDIEGLEGIKNLKENVTLKVDVEISNLKIKAEGTEFKVQKSSLSNNFKCKVNGNTLEVKEETTFGFNNKNNTSSIIICVPENTTLSELKLSTDIGKTQIDEIKTLKLDIEAGVGNLTLNNVESQKTNIDGGAGSVKINDSTLADLDLNCGVGETQISGDITGNSDIDSGVGSLKITLNKELDNYSIKTGTGLGSITLNGQKCLDGNKYGIGNNIIKIDGGVGSVKITTK